MKEWKPIKSAPKDETPILVARFNNYFKYWEYVVVKWVDETWAVVPTRDMRLSFIGTQYQSIYPPSE